MAGTVAILHALESNPGEHYKKLQDVMEELVSQPHKFKAPSKA